MFHLRSVSLPLPPFSTSVEVEDRRFLGGSPFCFVFVVVAVFVFFFC